MAFIKEAINICWEDRKAFDWKETSDIHMYCIYVVCGYHTNNMTGRDNHPMTEKQQSLIDDYKSTRSIDSYIKIAVMASGTPMII